MTLAEGETPPGESASVGNRPSSSHTSIVYFHGMGTPRRYEELTRVLDTLDRYAEDQSDPETIGRLRGQIIKLEASRVEPDEPVAFLQFFRLIWPNNGRQQRRIGSFRLFESYWSPAAAGGVSALHVLAWVIIRVFNPFLVLLSPWRAHQRLKRTFLSRMAFDRGAVPVDFFRELQKHYRAFEGMELRRRFKAGRFRQFKTVLEERTDPADRERILDLADRWRWSLVRSQLEVMLIGGLMAAALFGVTTLALGCGVRLLVLLGLDPLWLGTLSRRALALPAWICWLTAVVLPFAIVFGRAFFQNFLSDVVFWTTTFEKDVRYQKRRDILKASEATLRHVLADPQCERVVVIGHSLGTAIAYETLLNLGRRAKAQAAADAGMAPPAIALDPLLSKLSHFITFGSPVDRIAYFFSLQYSRYHRFNRVADDLAGRSSDTPFRINRAQSLLWWNVRDPADPVSSRLFSPRGSIPNREEITEVELTSSHVPDPVGAHVNYFNARLSAKLLFDACILNRGQVQAQSERTRLSRWAAKWGRRAAWSLAGALVICLAVGGAAFWLNDVQLATTSQLASLIIVVLIAGVAAACKAFDKSTDLVLPS